MVKCVNLNLSVVDGDISIEAFYGTDKKICEYKYVYSNGIVDSRGVNLGKTVLLGWAILDLSKVDTLKINVPLTNFEKEYLTNNYQYSVEIYEKIYKYFRANIEFKESVYREYERQKMDDGYYLGYSGGKDSTLCKKLLDDAQANYTIYKVSYSDDEPAKEGQIYCNIVDNDLYKLFALSEMKENSNYVSCHQADDIHVTFAVPYIFKKESYLNKLAVGIPWDAIHRFNDGCSELVPTETIYSVEFLEKLVKQYGFKEFKLISPIASLHTYGVYYTLSNYYSIDQLLAMDSCWESHENKGQGCGYCPKCQRLKRVFKDCFNTTYLDEVPDLCIENANFLFGSVYAKEIIKKLHPHKVMASVIIDKESVLYSGEFLDILKRKEFLKSVYVFGFDYRMSGESWEEIRNKIVNLLNINYSELSDVAINDYSVPYLPFEKHYKWGRKNKVLNCYNNISCCIDGINIQIEMSGALDGLNEFSELNKLKLPNNCTFNRFVKLNEKFQLLCKSNNIHFTRTKI